MRKISSDTKLRLNRKSTPSEKPSGKTQRIFTIIDMFTRKPLITIINKNFPKRKEIKKKKLAYNIIIIVIIIERENFPASIERKTPHNVIYFRRYAPSLFLLYYQPYIKITDYRL